MLSGSKTTTLKHSDFRIDLNIISSTTVFLYDLCFPNNFQSKASALAALVRNELDGQEG